MISRDMLKGFVERIECREEEKAEAASDLRDIYAEAKANGFDIKALRAVIKMRRQDAGERQEFEAILESYLQALGMTPLEQAIHDRDAA